MEERRPQCVIPWCTEHHDGPSHTHHRHEVGKASFQGEPLTVWLRFSESRVPNYPDLGPAVSMSWVHLPGDGTDEGPPFNGLDGLDLGPNEALQVGLLLVLAYTQMSGAGQ
jgi:hypothetical protein